MEKTYEIMFDSDGWCCRSQGILLGSFPSWLLAVGAIRASAEKDKRDGLTPVIRYLDIKGHAHSLDLESESAIQPPSHHNPRTLSRIDRLAPGQRPH